MDRQSSSLAYVILEFLGWPNATEELEIRYSQRERLLYSARKEYDNLVAANQIDGFNRGLNNFMGVKLRWLSTTTAGQNTSVSKTVRRSITTGGGGGSRGGGPLLHAPVCVASWDYLVGHMVIEDARLDGCLVWSRRAGCCGSSVCLEGSWSGHPAEGKQV